MNKTINKLIMFVFIFYAQVSYADWSLCNQVSSVNFITSQNDSLTEVHTFSNMEANISDQGHVLFNIDLSSVETNNSIRNLRLRELVFETDKFPEATITLDLGEGFLTELEIDKATEMPVQATLDLHGISKKIDTMVLITRLKSNCLLVVSIEPIIISLKDFDFMAGQEKFRQLAKLDSLTKTVKVSLNLFFRSNTVL